MKVYVTNKSITLAGKSWEIRRKLAEYAAQHATLADWISSVQGSARPKPGLRLIK
ncbi:Z-ring formation inhibitor MciZ [Peribacillus sp. SCS-37]|uniref:Z-ring formation inhibitor MciZ n=1 Tax=Paraperibacillus esterisolvens TaxID=3115296 RepID=UPI0039059838